MTRRVLLGILAMLVLDPRHAIGQIPDPEANGLRCVGDGCGSSEVPSRPVERRTSPSPERPRPAEPPKPSPAAVAAERQMTEARSRLQKEVIRLQTPLQVTARTTPGNVSVGVGSLFFESEFKDSPETPVSFAAPLANIRTPASGIPTENLRRATAILMTFGDAATAANEEDLSFLATEAALAMEGAPLRLEVSNLAARVPDAAVRSTANAVDQVARAAKEWQQAVGERLAVEKEIRALQNSRTASPEQLTNLSRRYERTLIAEKRASTQLTYVVIEVGKPRRP